MISIPVIYENDEILIVNKPAGLSVQGGVSVSHSLDEELSRQVGHKVFLVHRLDKETSGLLVVAKNPKAASRWISLVASKSVRKEYTALCFGVPSLNGKERSSGTVLFPILKDGKEQTAETRFTVIDTVLLPDVPRTDSDDSESGNAAEKTEVRLSRVSLELGTGRMHQIRIHMAKCGSPVAGDDRHGLFKLNKYARKNYGIKGLQLAATRLTVSVDGKLKTFEASLPEHMESVCKRFSL